MSIRRLLSRAPSASKIGIGILHKHELRFHKTGSLDGTGKCDAIETGVAEHYVYGVVFEISCQDKRVLDQIEGLGNGYEQKNVFINLDGGAVIEAFTYYATNIDSSLHPLDWYKTHVLTGARENSLPAKYIEGIEIVESIEDTEIERRERELSVYR